jgi:uncharacterized membrane protein YphA (DoxX/SURF4 family)
MILARTEGGSAFLAYMILRAGYAILPIVAGLDKFFDALAEWPKYLSPRIVGLVGVAPDTLMSVVGVVEIAAGVLVALWPRGAAWIVAAWLGAIIVNLILLPGYYDVALRDFGLLLGAIALALLARHFEER